MYKRCEGCGIDSWGSDPLPIYLIKKGGKMYAVCPNCYSTVKGHAPKPDTLPVEYLQGKTNNG